MKDSHGVTSWQQLIIYPINSGRICFKYIFYLVQTTLSVSSLPSCDEMIYLFVIQSKA